MSYATANNPHNSSSRRRLHVGRSLLKSTADYAYARPTYEDQGSNATLDSTADSYQHYKVIVEKHEAVTLHRMTKEASGMVALGIFMLCVQEEMQKLHPTVRFRVDYSPSVHPERTHAADGALLYSIIATDMIPCFVLEYKPRVAADLNDHLSEVFLIYGAEALNIRYYTV